jgi:aspartokinase/homoserine dehydrogenase 1
MNVLKFGGTSVGNASRILDVARIVSQAASKSRVGLVVSAVSGVTNHLIASAQQVMAGKPVAGFIDEFRAIHQGVLRDLGQNIEPKWLEPIEAELAPLIAEYENLLTGIKLLMECTPGILDHLSSLGERCSAPIVAAVLRAQGLTVYRLDPREFIITDNVFGNASPLMPEIEARFSRIQDQNAQVFLLPGFFGVTTSGKITTLGRGGSDYSAAILAAAVRAQNLEIWTDVDGVFTADPKVVPDAQVMAELSYAEAMELSFFGAKVLHPRTIAPVVALNIPTWIKNTFRPDFRGTLIQANVQESTWPVRGLTTLANVAMINLAGPGLRGVPGVAARVFSAMAREEISVILISQASSEYSISFCVAADQAEEARRVLDREFALEIQAKLVLPVEMADKLAILSVVGDQMKSRRGIAGSLFSALAAADVNIVSIAQAFSERTISVVVAAADAQRAMRATHQFFFNTAQGIQVFLLGPGAVGRQLLAQIAQQQPHLREQQVEVKVCGIADSRRMLIDFNGIALDSWKKALEGSSQPFQLETWLETIRQARLMNPVLVDCTGSQQMADAYLAIFEAGLHVVTPSKRANSGTLGYYQALRQQANRRRRQFLYSTNVGASLPIIETLKNMMKSGDALRTCQGILSGSLSFIFGRLDDGVPFSEAVAQARAKGFTEPDPRDDLSGLDVARKLMVLAREAGYGVEMSDVQIESPLPPNFDASGSIEAFCGNLPKADEFYATKVRQLTAEDRRLRFVARIEEGVCRVGLVGVAADDPLYHVKDGENAVSFLTNRYAPIPLVVRGYGAGPDVTAAGVFADLLRTVVWNTEIAK